MNNNSTTKQIQDFEDLWLDNADMMRIFHCSQSKLYSMRRSKKLPYVKFGSTIFYHKQTIIKILKDNEINII